MKALTLTQPWATLIALGTKRIENRPWKPPLVMSGERFAIHASRAIDPDVRAFLIAEGHLPADLVLPKSRIVAVATLASYVTSAEQVEREVGADQAIWWSGPIAFVLEDVRPVDVDIEVRGALSFWRLPENVERAIEEQLR